MPKIRIRDLDLYFEQAGAGPPLVLVHGAFADLHVWDPQWEFFISKNRIVRYDLRAHGKTGASRLENYSIQTFADDLSGLLDTLGIESPVICGLSWGGSIAQAFAIRYPDRLKLLVLASSAVAIDLTLVDKLLCRVLFPSWAMRWTIRLLDVKRFVRFSLGLARLVQGKHWLSQQEAVQVTLERSMLSMDHSEYLKVWQAIYSFRLLPLEKIRCPVLVLNGERESKNTFRHTQEILNRIPQAESKIIPAAWHAMNLDHPEVFNQCIQKYLLALDQPD